MNAVGVRPAGSSGLEHGFARLFPRFLDSRHPTVVVLSVVPAVVEAVKTPGLAANRAFWRLVTEGSFK